MPTAWELRTVKLTLPVIREFYCLKLLGSRFIQKLFISSESEMQCTNFKKIGLVRWKIVKHTSFLTPIESKSRLLRVVFRAPRSIFLISIFLYKSELDQHKIKPEFQERNFISRRHFFWYFSTFKNWYNWEGSVVTQFSRRLLLRNIYKWARGLLGLFWLRTNERKSVINLRKSMEHQKSMLQGMKIIWSS